MTYTIEQSTTRWQNIAAVEEEGMGEISVGQLWTRGTDLSDAARPFFLSGPRYDNRDAIVGSWYERLPAAQQYGLRCTAWLAARKLAEAKALANLARVLFGHDEEPF